MPTSFTPTALGAKHESEYELLDTGVFSEDRYFDVFVDYARINPTDVNMLDHRPQSRARKCDHPPSPAALVSKYVVMEGRLS